MPLVGSMAGLPAPIPGTGVSIGGPLAIAFLAVAWAAGWAISRLGFRGVCVAAMACWGVCVAMLLLALQTMPLMRQWPQTTGDAPMGDLVWLAPVLVFGFALCPYLDLTIHRARQETPGRGGDLAFVVGFGALFLAMIVGTLAYAQAWIDDAAMSFYVVGHIALQSAFTIGVHLRALRDTARTTRERSATTPMLAGILLGLAPSSALVVRALHGTVLEPLSRMDGVYRVFMACYGLLFPALLWTWSASGRDDRRATLAALFCVGLAAPMFWMGFLEGRWFWLAPGLLVALSGPGWRGCFPPSGACQRVVPRAVSVVWGAEGR